MEHEEWNDDCRGQCREPPYFAIEVHHGGRFVCRPTKVYTGGKTQTVHGIDPDVMSLLELDAMAQVLGYADKLVYYYKLPGLNLDIGLVHITSDKIASEMSKFLDNNRTVVMYLEEVGGVKVVDSQLGSSSMNAACDMGLDFGLQDIGPDFGLEDVDFGSAILFMNNTGPGGVDLNVLDGSGGVHGTRGVDGGTEHVVEEMEGTDEDDSSCDLDVYYSDHSYDEEDDDNLYETYVDDYEEFVGVNNEDQGEVDGDDLDIVLSDGDSKYDSENSNYISSDEENSNRRKHHFKKFRPDTDMADPQFRVGMLFSSPHEFKAVVKEYAIKQQRNVKLVKNDKQRIRARCEKKCQWELYAAKVMTESTCQVRTYRGVHNCGKTYSNRNVTSTVIAKKFMDELRINPHMPIAVFKERVRKDLKVDVSRNQLYKAKRKAGKLIYGTNIEQYGRLWDYCEELRRSNPGSTVVLDAPLDESGQPKFRRLYIFLHAIKTGFLGGCRQIVGVDVCHLKGEYGGQLLTAVGVDPNNAMYPMAWCVVENENKDTWTWFMTLLKMDLKITSENEHEWTMINDRQKGLLSLLNEEMVRAEHRYCCKHILSNFQKQFSGLSLEDKFWSCAKASHVPRFHDAMEEMKAEDPQAYDWLVKISPRHWSKSHFNENVKCDMVCNNLCEAFNRAILEAREKPIIEMLEWIRCYMSKRMVVRREWIRKFIDELLPNPYNLLENLKDYSATYNEGWFGNLQFQVRQGEKEQYTVDLNLRTCSCRRWDLTGIPCPHAIAAIHERHKRPEDFIHSSYSKSSYLRAYQPLIKPINGYNMWPKTGFTPVLPPDERRKLGRPKNNRILGPEEYLNPKDPAKLRKVGQNSVFCRRCGVHGHNRRTCTTPFPKGTKDVREGARGVQSQSKGRATRGGLQTRGTGLSIGSQVEESSARGRGLPIGTRSRPRGRGRNTSMRVRGGGVGIQSQTNLGDVNIQPQAREQYGVRVRASGVKVRGSGARVRGGMQPQARGRGVRVRGGGVGSSVKIRGGGIGSQVFVPSNYDQATEGSQASTVITVPSQKAGIRYANTNKLHGGQ